MKVSPCLTGLALNLKMESLKNPNAVPSVAYIVALLTFAGATVVCLLSMSVWSKSLCW